MPTKPDPLSALPGGQSADQVGMYHWDLRTDTWSWSSEIYLMYGYQPGSVTPSLELLAKHGHPKDHPALVELFEAVRRSGEAFGSQQRIAAADEGTRAVVVVGNADTENEVPTAVHGYYVDLTSARLREAEHLSELAGEAAGLQRAMASRATIEQAKGMIMFAYGCGSAAAFDLLINTSQRANIKLRELADRLVAVVQNPDDQPERARAHLDAMLARLARPAGDV
ncbi:ANTAR domain-containing protein [Amycolatopsis acidiphila]|uniref:ANTAR domain-containing protein n=1 Tax=Amycolatopsis acidiphila TaxID=715473 RepID=A0A558A7F8_9PSEU|nr:ANTAR domain-containing protein [Amycolatopsis acidiphila]TVT20199.1 ANTAR domain-containing protein [Amycolatopsis acidiphila]UIJ58256.1 ANTAR domain-containing protein [Amycolatopsis acidiphila]GHG69151.1 putative transcription antitermination regulator [Amycolatopsis acidiphila]